MTAYRERHHAGIHANPAEAKELTLAELKARAEALNLPTYGTKDQLQDRINKAAPATTTSQDLAGLQ